MHERFDCPDLHEQMRRLQRALGHNVSHRSAHVSQIAPSNHVQQEIVAEAQA